MIMRIYTVWDKVAKEAGPLFESKNDGTALRAFKQFIKRENGSNPSEFELRFLGEMDHEIPVINAWERGDQVIDTTIEEEMKGDI